MRARFPLQQILIITQLNAYLCRQDICCGKGQSSLHMERDMERFFDLETTTILGMVSVSQRAHFRLSCPFAMYHD